MRKILKPEQSKPVSGSWYLVSSVFVFLTILLDQVSKVLVVSSYVPFVCNEGFAFGIRLGILNSLTVIIIISVCIYFYRRERERIRRLGYLLVVSGGISNLVDRLVRGCVVDFIDFKIWPAFNLADAAITVGVAVLIVSLIYRKKFF